MHQRRVLRIALALNAVMFAGETAAGILARSSGLIADSLVMLANAVALRLGTITCRAQL